MHATKTESAGAKGKRSRLLFAFCVAALTIFLQFQKYRHGVDTFWNVRLLYLGATCLLLFSCITIPLKAVRARSDSAVKSGKKAHGPARSFFVALGLIVFIIVLASAA